MKNLVTTTPQKTGNLGIIFIKTNTSGYGIDANGVRYLTLQKGENGTVKGGTMKVALLNLGQSADCTPEGGYVPNNDAGDLGDFYQWGRIADGHQNTVWSKPTTGTSRANQITPMTGGVKTSAVINYKDGGTVPSYNDLTHQVESSTKYYGKFIYSTGSGAANGDADWYYNSGHDNSLWGSTKSSTTRASDISLSDWTYSSNNPCPSGWHVPSRWNFLDLYKGDGSTTTFPTSAEQQYQGTDNTWAFRAMNTAKYAVGGVILTNSDNEQLFLPASGCRLDSSGALVNAGTNGYYWSSTYSNSQGAYGLSFSSGPVIAGSNHAPKAYGQFVRCVAEF
jgi:uncharacterized protein (TIGR02145 family)